MPEIQGNGATLVAISPQTPATTEDFVMAQELDYPVLSDMGAAVANEYGLVFELPVELRSIYEQFGIDIPGSNGDRSFRLPLPATYVIAEDGTIEWAWVSTDYTTRAEPAEILEALEEL